MSSTADIVRLDYECIPRYSEWRAGDLQLERCVGVSERGAHGRVAEGGRALVLPHDWAVFTGECVVEVVLNSQPENATKMADCLRQQLCPDDLQRYMSEGDAHLLRITVSDNKLNILIAFHRNSELTTTLRIPPFYAQSRSPLYLIVIEIIGFRDVIDQVPAEASYPAIAEIELNANSLRVATCEGDGYIEVHLGDSAQLSINLYDREIGSQVEERILFVHTENLTVNEAALRELIS